jgi:hypothetical protein
MFHREYVKLGTTIPLNLMIFLKRFIFRKMQFIYKILYFLYHFHGRNLKIKNLENYFQIKTHEKFYMKTVYFGNKLSFVQLPVWAAPLTQNVIK